MLPGAAEAEVTSLTRQLAAGADFDVLMKAHSEDPGSAMKPEGYTVSPDAQLVIGAVRLATTDPQYNPMTAC